MDVVYAGSPLEGLAGSPVDGDLALILGRPGVGATTLLVHVALNELFLGGRVLHVALDASVDHTRAHYDELLRLISARIGADRIDNPALVVERGRVMHSFRERPFSMQALQQDLQLQREAAGFEPTVLLLGGLEHDEQLPQRVEELSALARRLGVRCWASVHSEAPLPSACFERAALAVRLVPDGERVRLQRVHGPGSGEDLPSVLEASTLLSLDAEEAPPDRPLEKLSPRHCTLYSGGAAGSEAAFGEIAARWGVREVAFTFEGHLQERTEGRHELSPRELAMGDVSLAYVSKRLNRSYNDRGGLIRCVLQTLWHMVSRSQQIFVIGTIQGDGTVRGGTGWSVELARMWSRELWVFDQARGRWHQWSGSGWVPGTPRITTPHLCGTGTRQIDDAGRKAIEALFEASFGGLE